MGHGGEHKGAKGSPCKPEDTRMCSGKAARFSRLSNYSGDSVIVSARI